jgi:hypothetical protein
MESKHFLSKVPTLDLNQVTPKTKIDSSSALEKARRNKKLFKSKADPAVKQNLDSFIEKCDLGIEKQLGVNRFSNNGSNLLIPLKNSENVINSIKKEMKTLASISRHLNSHSGNKVRTVSAASPKFSTKTGKKLFGAEITINTTYQAPESSEDTTENF